MITENYIKMCEMVEEVQKGWIPKEYDYYRQISYNKIDKKTSKITNRLDELYLFNKKTNNNLFNVKRFWLPTLEQLQEMMPVNNVTSLVKHIKGAELRYHDRFDKNCVGYFTGTFYSMKELWLAFVMYEKYHKSWTGKKWEAK